jgi:hypothetical protein
MRPQPSLFEVLPEGTKFHWDEHPDKVFVKDSPKGAHHDGAFYPIARHEIVEPLEQIEWEGYTIQIGHYEDIEELETERSELTERFESELYRLVKKYNGRLGLIFDARDSTNRPIIEY